MSLTWVAGSEKLPASGATSHDFEIPAGVSDDDGVFAFVIARGALDFPVITPPSGWTEVATATIINGTTGAYFYVYAVFEKDTVLSTDAETTHSFTTDITAIAMGGVAVMQPTTGPVTLMGDWARANTFDGVGNETTQSGAVQLTAEVDGEIICIVHACGSEDNIGENGYPLTPTGATMWSSTSTGGTDYRYMGLAYDLVNTGQSNDAGGFTHHSSANEYYSRTYSYRFQDAGDVGGPVTYEDEITEGVGFFEAIEYPGTNQVAISDTLSFDPFAQGYLQDTVSATDGLGLSVPQAFAIRRQATSLSETLGLAPEAIYKEVMVIREAVRLADTMAPAFTYQLTASDSLSFADAVRKAIPQTLSETLGVEPVAAAAYGVTILQQLGVNLVATPNFTYGIVTEDTLRVRDALAKFINATVSETVGFAETLGLDWRFMASVSEGLGVADSVTPRLLINMVVNETLALDDAQLLNMVFAGVLEDTLRLSAAYVSPDGAFTTWAINTNKGYVSEYRDYAFNSFARMGNKYIGASDDGLFELNGDTDDGAEIIARIKSGTLQFGNRTAQLAGFKGAYLGIRGEGEFYLKIETGDGKSYTYKTSVESMKTAKVNIGKGVRARYFSFELISAGQDFDLESIEFLPLVANRRV